MATPAETGMLLLASGSPRRAELLREAGYEFTVVVPTIDEPNDRLAAASPASHAEALAYFKARFVARAHPQALVLGADTVAALGDDVIGKPVDRDDARRILSRLSGRPHRVITAIALLDGARGRRLIEHDVTHVFVRRLERDWIERYLDSGQWQGKAGAYGLQERDDEFVLRIEGSFSNVVGLPMERLAAALAEL